MRVVRVAVCCLVATAATAQTGIPPALQRLASIKQHMKERLTQVPNYTCLETVERSDRLKVSSKFKNVDTVRFEVAEVDGRELYARPGQQFEHTNPSALVHGGTIASGLFAMFANALFLNDIATIVFAGDEEIGGRNLARYDFSVHYLRSGFVIRNRLYSALVAYHGSFWADPESLDALHLRIVADDIPPALGLQDAGAEIEFQRVRIGEAEALLPRLANLLLTEFSGTQRRNVTIFSQCRQYGSQSVLTFEDPANK